jgi:hypothetical protein
LASLEDGDDYVYTHRVSGVLNSGARHPIPPSLLHNLVNE